jgi:hypothetical protein
VIWQLKKEERWRKSISWVKNLGLSQGSAFWQELRLTMW